MLALVLFTLLLTLLQATPPQYLLIKIPQSYAISQTYATVFFEVQFEYSPILKSYNQVNTEGNAVEYTVTCPSGTSTGTYEFSPFINPYDTLLPLSVFIPSKATPEVCLLEISLIGVILSNTTTFVGGSVRTGRFIDSITSLPMARFYF